MKKLSLLFILISIINVQAFTQCPDYLIIESQDQIDNFKIQYPNCSQIEGYVSINGDDITDLAGLDNLTSIGGHFLIHGNGMLSSLSGLENLTTVSGYLNISNNDLLLNLNGLENLTNVFGYQLNISYNDALINLTEWENLHYLEGSVVLAQNSSLNNLNGLNYIDSIGNHLILSNNYNLVDITALENVTSIGGKLEIKKCNSLIDLTGLNNISSINGSLEIIENNSLENLSGIDSINAETISDLVINFNPLLSYCHVKSICDYIFSPNGDLSIHSNSPGCNNYVEVEDACTVSTNEVYGENAFLIYPNPTNSRFNFASTDLLILELNIYNKFGQKVHSEFRPENTVDVSLINPGLYIIEFVTSKTRFNEKLIIRD